jgi:hypothetical protein
MDWDSSTTRSWKIQAPLMGKYFSVVRQQPNWGPSYMSRSHAIRHTHTHTPHTNTHIHKHTHTHTHTNTHTHKHTHTTHTHTPHTHTHTHHGRTPLNE